MTIRALALSLVLATSFAAPALAADATTPTSAATKADTSATDAQAMANLKEHLKALGALGKKLVGLKARGAAASKAEIDKTNAAMHAEADKVRASLGKFKAAMTEAKAEGKAAKAMMLSKLISGAEKQLNKLDPLAPKPTPTP